MPDLWKRSQKRLDTLVLCVALLKIRYLALRTKCKSKRHVLKFSVCELKRVETTNIVMRGNFS